MPETGELLWKYDAAPVALRGLAYWPGAGSLHPRVFTGNGLFLLALDVTTGKPAPGFGNEGRVDLRKGVLGDLKEGRYALQSPPAVFGDVVITGCSNGEGSPSAGAYGDIRGWDAKTGKLLWTFHTVARPGEPGSETWPSGGWKNRSDRNAQRRCLRGYPGLGCEDRKAALDLSHGGAAGGAGIGNVAFRWLEESIGAQRMGVLHDRCEARNCVRASGIADLRLLWRGSGWRRPVRGLSGGARCSDGHKEVAPTVGAPRSLGL